MTHDLGPRGHRERERGRANPESYSLFGFSAATRYEGRLLSCTSSLLSSPSPPSRPVTSASLGFTPRVTV